MATAKIIKSDDLTVTLGYEDGSFEQIPRSELNLGKFAPDGALLDVYTSGDQKVYTFADKKKNAGGDLMDKVSDQYHSKKKVSKVAYVACAWLLGGIGLHKFISGKWLFGILYVLFCWTYIPMIISFIEGIIAITKPSDENGRIEI